MRLVVVEDQVYDVIIVTCNTWPIWAIGQAAYLHFTISSQQVTLI